MCLFGSWVVDTSREFPHASTRMFAQSGEAYNTTFRKPVCSGSFILRGKKLEKGSGTSGSTKNTFHCPMSRIGRGPLNAPRPRYPKGH